MYGLSLPRGHAFGDRPPVESWQSEDALAWGAVTRDVNDRTFGILVMRRREETKICFECAKRSANPWKSEGSQRASCHLFGTQ